VRNSDKQKSQLAGCLIGCAVGDALGLSREGISPRRAMRLFGPATRYSFFSGYGFVSDDTDHHCLVANALMTSGGDPVKFEPTLARNLRRWLFTIPPGIGFATLRALLKLCLGFGPAKSGVFSAGNGPAMRAAIIGLYADDELHLKELVERATRITHTDPQAFHSAHAIALVARLAAANDNVIAADFRTYPRSYMAEAQNEMLDLIDRVTDAADISTADFAVRLGLSSGVSGYALHTVPICLHAWLTNQRDFLATVRAAIECGGDADTTGAIAGALAGSQLGLDSIPNEFRSKLVSAPWSHTWIERIADALVNRDQLRTPVMFSKLALRNLATLAVIFLHIFRRALPPY